MSSLPKDLVSSQEFCNQLIELLSEDYNSLFNELDVSLRRVGRMFVGCCPIHDGNNETAFNLYREGEQMPGFWQCRSHHCHKFFRSTLIGFVRGLLSKNKLGWTLEDGYKRKQYGFTDTLEFIVNFLKLDVTKLKFDAEERENKKFLNCSAVLNKKVVAGTGIDRDLVRRTLKIPCDYYLKKGFSKEILERYDVGLCTRPGKEMSGRVVVPVYDKTGKQFLCCTGRSLEAECTFCGLCHPAGPCPAFHLKYVKWRHTEGINSHLYNYWHVLPDVKKSKSIILVEGPADVWRLEELGVKNAVCLFGNNITDEQQILLETSGAMNVILLMDNDKGGEEGVQSIKPKLDRMFNLHVPKLSVTDPSDLTSLIYKQELEPLLNKVRMKTK